MLDPIQLQVLTGALRAACEEMGVTLIRSAHSSNIKERRDASTALFNAGGEMIMQAEHIPVHLGAMPAAVAAVLRERHAPGVSWILNDPFAGGTHLPDITVITPVFAEGMAPAGVAGAAAYRHCTTPMGGEVHQPGRVYSRCDTPAGREVHPSSGAYNRCDTASPPPTLIGFAASRAHHADVGARMPGSMPADSRQLDEEGIVISSRPLDAQTIEELAMQMRQPAERRADLRAQLAANRIGAARLVEISRGFTPDDGKPSLDQAIGAVLDYSERRTRACIAALPDGTFHAEDVLEALDGDLPLRLRASVEGERLVLDFSGSSPQHDGNLNCPLAVTRSACLFAVRVLTDPDIPSSAGAYRPIEVIAPEGSLLNANPGAAVAAGNVETSSRVADLVLSAFGRAQGQGTMNNLTLGNAGFSYYETLGGGQGACEDADGPSAVHVAMSNTLNTPIEALERDFPLRVIEYSLRTGSGGAGCHRGGDGLVREIEALQEMTFSLIAERRRNPPQGAHGGGPGALGRDLLDGHQLPGKATGTLHPGQRLRIETPGGGGFGDA